MPALLGVHVTPAKAPACLATAHCTAAATNPSPPPPLPTTAAAATTTTTTTMATPLPNRRPADDALLLYRVALLLVSRFWFWSWSWSWPAQLQSRVDARSPKDTTPVTAPAWARRRCPEFFPGKFHTFG